MKQNKVPFSAIIETPIGLLGIKVADEKVIGIEFLANAETFIPKDKFTLHVIKDLQQYFKNPTHKFKLALNISGSDFQKKAWAAIAKIPSGKTASYGELAKLLHTSPRAIGNACKTNPIPLIIPCHRVTAKDGIGGFSGVISGTPISIKSFLLEHETINKK